MKSKILALTLLVAAVSLSAWAAARVGYKASLSGAEMVPAVKTGAAGGALFDFSPEGKSLHFNLSVKNLADVTAAHIHLGARGKEGPVVAILYPLGGSPPLKAGKFSGILAKGVITAANLEGPLKGKPLSDLEKEIKFGNAYVMVHTKTHPQGELRGQIVRRPT
jgi:hypothetical protein